LHRNFSLSLLYLQKGCPGVSITHYPAAEVIVWHLQPIFFAAIFRFVIDANQGNRNNLLHLKILESNPFIF